MRSSAPRRLAITGTRHMGTSALAPVVNVEPVDQVGSAYRETLTFVERLHRRLLGGCEIISGADEEQCTSSIGNNWDASHGDLSIGACRKRRARRSGRFGLSRDIDVRRAASPS